MVRISESVRERETFKYDPYLIPDHGLDQSGQLVASGDTTLTALAQLGALRLNAARGIISLFDRDTQYVAAEATPNIPLAPSIVHDGIWVCGATVPRTSSICEHVLTASETNTAEWLPTAELVVKVVPDLATDERFCNSSSIHQRPFNRFYAGIAIRSPRGINIGVFCIFDTKPRTGLDDESMQVMKDLSRTIMDYLECKMSSQRYQRSERMVRGIGSFIQAKKATQRSRQVSDLISILPDASESEKRLKEVVIPAKPDAVDHRAIVSLTPATSHAQPGSTQALASPSSIAVKVKPSAASLSEVRVSDVHRLFSRAADIIRESIEVDGALFLDASIATFGGLVPTLDRELSGTSSSEEDTLGRQTGSGKRHCDLLGFSTPTGSSLHGGTAIPAHEAVSDMLLEGLLRHYPKGAIFSFDKSGELQSGDDSDGSGASQSDKERPDETAGEDMQPVIKPSRASLTRQKEAKLISSLCPGARTAAVIPLWDLNKERWFAGGFVWTTTPSRVFTPEGDLSFLRAFGMTIMAEVARIEATISDKAKGDVLGSLSHELRSPLHGVVAAVDLLHGTDLDVFQSDVIHTIETSGRTLLDTIDHLLDYSKINNFLLASGLERRKNKPARGLLVGRQPSIESGMISLLSDVQLDLITEEVVEAVFAGHNFQISSMAQLDARQSARHSDTHALRRLDSIHAIEDFGHDIAVDEQLQLAANPVFVYLDIDPAVPWSLHAQPGALRRIIMNLFGNALKYTTKGSIVISLRQELPPNKKVRSIPSAVLTVTDSGKGIGQDYLRNRLFMPFAQEDNLSAGSGLGLSLVKQITSSLGGTIAVESALRCGTSVRVSLPLIRPHQPKDEETEFISNIQQLKGLRVSLLGFSEATESRLEQGSKRSGLDVMTTLCRDWLHLEVVASTDEPDLVVCTETVFPGLDGDACLGKLLPAVVVICRNAVAARSLSLSRSATGQSVGIEFISQPAAPRKIAKTLVHSLCRWKQAQSTAPAEPSAAPPVLAGPGRVLTSSPAPRTPSPLSTTKPDLAGEISAQPPSQPQQAIPNPPTGVNNLSQARMFLLVDDNKINLRILSSYMTKSNIAHTTALNGLEALEAYIKGEGRYSCILMDVSMPIMDGLESTRRIREFERNSKLKAATIIALTGLASASIQQEAFASGIDLFLTKPVRLKELGNILDSKVRC